MNLLIAFVVQYLVILSKSDLVIFEDIEFVESNAQEFIRTEVLG